MSNFLQVPLLTRVGGQDRRPLVAVTPVPEDLEKKVDELHSSLNVEEMTEEQAKAELLKAFLGSIVPESLLFVLIYFDTITSFFGGNFIRFCGDVSLDFLVLFFLKFIESEMHGFHVIVYCLLGPAECNGIDLASSLSFLPSYMHTYIYIYIYYNSIIYIIY